MSIRAMLARVQRIEAARAAPRSPVEQLFGSLDAFDAAVRYDVDGGRLDRVDMLGPDGNGGVLRAIRAWHEQQLWDAWQRNRVWEYGR